MKKENGNWTPLAEKNLGAIRQLFRDILPEGEYGDLAESIADDWVSMLTDVWQTKAASIKQKDLRFSPSDPLSRIQQKTVVIAYADSVSKAGEPSLVTLDRFLGRYFPAVRGLHMLPACRVVEGRFNDGFFSQVVRDEIHEAFGSNQTFSDMMEKYYSMADFVLNHVDIANPMFQAYLNGDDDKKDCFFIYSEQEYQARSAQGDFDQIFRPRPFPLFSIFRRKPADKACRALSHAEKVIRVQELLGDKRLPGPVIGLLSIFNKIRNDQMLLDDDYQHIVNFRSYLDAHTKIDPDTIFTLSATQETDNKPYIFQSRITCIEDLLKTIGHDGQTTTKCADAFRRLDRTVFGEEVRALTTFSHVQVDLNTSTYQGLKMLADDFSWYLRLDLDMLRLDAANFAFKKWKTTCFGLPEVSGLMNILYQSINAVAPRIVANLEVNDQLGNILSQMADKTAPPPMMYDFHLPCILPAVFNTGDATILPRIFEKISHYEIPKDSIRFSVAESHDGKSVRGSMDILTLAERQKLADTVERNNGRIKYKSVPQRQMAVAEFSEVCRGAGIQVDPAAKALFAETDPPDGILRLNDRIRKASDMAAALGISETDVEKTDTLKFFVNKALYGREPYELCVSSRDALTRLDSREHDIKRYLAFYTLAFALMGRHVKSIYFNDLMGLPNDYERMAKTGELRDIKRTKSDYHELEARFQDSASSHSRIAGGINNIIALVDADPAFHFRGNEADAPLLSGGNLSRSVAAVHNASNDHYTLVLVNLGPNAQDISIDLNRFGLAGLRCLVDNISGQKMTPDTEGQLAMTLGPYQRIWLTRDSIKISPDVWVEV